MCTRGAPTTCNTGDFSVSSGGVDEVRKAKLDAARAASASSMLDNSTDTIDNALEAEGPGQSLFWPLVGGAAAGFSILLLLGWGIFSCLRRYSKGRVLPFDATSKPEVVNITPPRKQHTPDSSAWKKTRKAWTNDRVKRKIVDARYYSAHSAPNTPSSGEKSLEKGPTNI